MSEPNNVKGMVKELEGLLTLKERPTNWNNLTPELKTQVVKWMNIPTRLNLRQTAREERDIVDTIGLRAYFVHFDDERIDLSTDNGQMLMIRYKKEQNKFLPFLVYLFRVLFIHQMYVAPSSRWFFEKVCKRLPGGRASLRINSWQESYTEMTFSDKVHGVLRRMARNIVHSCGVPDPAECDPVYELIDNWSSTPLMCAPTECLIFDRNPLPMPELMASNPATPPFYGVKENYDIGRMRMIMNLKYHIYCYKQLDSHWMYMMLVPGCTKPEELNKEDKWANFSGLTKDLEFKTHDQLCDEMCERDPEHAEFYKSHRDLCNATRKQWH